jgi:hypothetical protein
MYQVIPVDAKAVRHKLRGAAGCFTGLPSPWVGANERPHRLPYTAERA